MSDYDVRVVRGPKTTKRPGRLRRAAGTTWQLSLMILLRPRLLVLSGLAVFVLFVGTPHVGWDYECRHPFSPTYPCRSVSYCAYYGIQGRRVEFPDYGETCKLVTLIPPDWGRIIDRVMP